MSEITDREIELLKEFVKSEVKSMATNVDGLRREATLRQEVTNARLHGMDMANEQLKTENERRFQELNALRKEYTENRTEDGKKLVDWNTYNAKVSEIQTWKDWANNQITTITTKSAVWTAAIGLVFTVLIIIIQLWKK